MKTVIIICSILLSIENTSFSQTQLIRPITQKVLGKIIPRLAGQEEAILSSRETGLLFKTLPQYSVNVTDNEAVLFYKGKLYKTRKEMAEAIIKPYDPNTGESAKENQKKMRKALELIGRYNSTSTGLTFQPPKRSDIEKIQYALHWRGYKVKYDGIYGKETREAIEDCFMINVEGLTEKEICDWILRKKTPIKRFPASSYALEIQTKNQSEPTIYKGTVSELQTHLAEFHCGLGEICASLGSEKSFSITMECTNKSNVGVSIKLSSDISAEFTLDMPNDQQLKVGINSSGKVDLQTSDRGILKGSSFKLN